MNDFNYPSETLSHTYATTQGRKEEEAKKAFVAKTIGLKRYPSINNIIDHWFVNAFPTPVDFYCCQNFDPKVRKLADLLIHSPLHCIFIAKVTMAETRKLKETGTMSDDHSTNLTPNFQNTNLTNKLIGDSIRPVLKDVVGRSQSVVDVSGNPPEYIKYKNRRLLIYARKETCKHNRNSFDKVQPSIKRRTRQTTQKLMIQKVNIQQRKHPRRRPTNKFGSLEFVDSSDTESSSNDESEGSSVESHVDDSYEEPTHVTPKYNTLDEDCDVDDVLLNQETQELNNLNHTNLSIKKKLHSNWSLFAFMTLNRYETTTQEITQIKREILGSKGVFNRVATACAIAEKKGIYIWVSWEVIKKGLDEERWMLPDYVKKTIYQHFCRRKKTSS